MDIETIEIPTLADPRDVIRVKVIYPDEWPAPPFGTELLVAVYRKTFFLFPSWSFWAQTGEYSARRVNSTLGVKEVQKVVDAVANEYDLLRKARREVASYAS